MRRSAAQAQGKDMWHGRAKAAGTRLFAPLSIAICPSGNCAKRHLNPLEFAPVSAVVWRRNQRSRRAPPASVSCPPGSVRSGDSNPSDRAWPYLSGLIEPILSLSAGIKARLGRSYSPHLHISQTHTSQHARPAAAKVDHGRGYPWAMAFRARALSGKAAISQATPCAKALRFWAMRGAGKAAGRLGAGAPAAGRRREPQ